MVLHSKKLRSFELYKMHFIWLFDSICIPLLKMAPQHNVKIQTHFSEKTVCFFCRHSSQRTMTLLSRYYTARGGATMNFAKKSRLFTIINIKTLEICLEPCKSEFGI